MSAAADDRPLIRLWPINIGTQLRRNSTATLPRNDASFGLLFVVPTTIFELTIQGLQRYLFVKDTKYIMELKDQIRFKNAKLKYKIHSKSNTSLI